MGQYKFRIGKIRINKKMPSFKAVIRWPSHAPETNVKVFATLQGITFKETGPMAVFRDISHMFTSFKYFKRGSVIIKKATIKCCAIEAKIKVRNHRVEDIRKQYDITDADLVELYRQKQQNSGASTYTLTSNSASGKKTQPSEKVIPAGAIANIDTELAAITNEKNQAEHLSLMIRNLDPKKTHEIDFSELEFLGF